MIITVLCTDTNVIFIVLYYCLTIHNKYNYDALHPIIAISSIISRDYLKTKQTKVAILIHNTETFGLNNGIHIYVIHGENYNLAPV